VESKEGVSRDTISAPSSLRCKCTHVLIITYVNEAFTKNKLLFE